MTGRLSFKLVVVAADTGMLVPLTEALFIVLSLSPVKVTVMADPAGTQETSKCIAIGPVYGGATGAAALVGVTVFEAALAAEVPAPLVALAVKVYEVPLVRPVTSHEVAGELTVQVAPPGEAATL